MKRWERKVAALGARMWLHELSDGTGWVCVLLPADTPREPIYRAYMSRAMATFRDDAIRAAIANYDPPFRTYAEHYAHLTNGRKHPW